MYPGRWTFSHDDELLRVRRAVRDEPGGLGAGLRLASALGAAGAFDVAWSVLEARSEPEADELLVKIACDLVRDQWTQAVAQIARVSPWLLPLLRASNGELRRGLRTRLADFSKGIEPPEVGARSAQLAVRTELTNQRTSIETTPTTRRTTMTWP